MYQDSNKTVNKFDFKFKALILYQSKPKIVVIANDVNYK